jgi:hypothetical protein
MAQHCGVAVQNVHAYIVGEHGDSEVPLWSSATIGAVPLLRWNNFDVLPLDTTARADIFRRVVRGGYDILAGKGFTNYAISLATTRIIESVLYDALRRTLGAASQLADRRLHRHQRCVPVCALGHQPKRRATHPAGSALIWRSRGPAERVCRELLAGNNIEKEPPMEVEVKAGCRMIIPLRMG